MAITLEGVWAALESLHVHHQPSLVTTAEIEAANARLFEAMGPKPTDVIYLHDDANHDNLDDLCDEEAIGVTDKQSVVLASFEGHPAGH
jgi:hypothetical protein